jgi:hypothetical protein
VRVWYATEGKHAPELTSTRPDNVPDHVALASQVAEDALDGFLSWGFQAPPDDTETGCDGGDGLLDVYLMAFAAADGLASPTRCAQEGDVFRCSSYLIVERKPQNRGYKSFEEGIRTILPHELFHAVQNGYNAGMDRYWAEGTAQWAADRLSPSLTDLESYLPAFLSQPSRPLDLPPSGVTASFLYGSALWPVFLEQRRGVGVILGALGRQGEGLGAYAAVAASLQDSGVDPAEEMTTFRAWNAATGERWAEGGYPGGASYPEVPYVEDGVVTEGGAWSGVMAGLSSRYRPYDFAKGQRVTLDANPERVRGVALPMVEGRVQLAQARALPAELEGPGVLVLAGVSEKKSDASFAVKVEAIPEPEPTPEPAPTGSTPAPAPTPAPTPSAPAPSSGGEAAPEAEGGCSTGPKGQPMTGLGWGVLAWIVARRRGRRHSK